MQSNSQLKYLTLLSQCIACYLTAYYVEKKPFYTGELSILGLLLTREGGVVNL